MRNLTKRADLNLYLVNVVVLVSRYMVDEEETIHKTHIVRANEEWEANTKIHKYYEDKCSPYDVSYRIQSLDITEEIS